MAGSNKKDIQGIDLDTLLVEEVGQFGKYQITTLLLASLPVMFTAWAAGEYIFTIARLPTRCLIPECDGSDPEYAPEWLLNAVPGSSLTSFDNCNRYANLTMVESEQLSGACPADLFDQAQTIGCDSYVYEYIGSIVYDFGLECDEWRRTLTGSVRTIGTLIVLPITGFISDRWGRRVALSINAFNTAWVGVVRSFANSYNAFLFLEVLEASIGAGTYSSCFLLVTELVGPKYRVLAGAILFSFVALGQVSLGLLAWGVQNWRSLTRVLYVPQLFVITYFWILAESVRWLMSKGRFSEAEVILKKAAKINNKSLSDKSLEALRASGLAQLKKDKVKEPWLIVLIWRCNPIFIRCFITPIWWITTTLIYYGMSINAVNLAGNRFLNYVYVTAIEIPGYWSAIFVLNKIGRKYTLVIGYFLCSACQFAFAFMPANMETLSLIIYLLGKYAISVVVTSVYVYTAELYPTKYRHSLFAFSSMIGRLGSITAPLTPALAMYWAGIPSVIFGSFSFVSGMLIFTTPETLNTKLPDTLEEAATLGQSTQSV